MELKEEVEKSARELEEMEKMVEGLREVIKEKDL